MLDWPEIVRQHGPAVWQTACKILGNPADAEECFQETFLAALQLSRRQTVQCWRALLQHLAAARAVDHLRRRRRAPPQQVTDWETLRGPGPSPSQSAEENELAQRLRDALAHLPAQQADVFCLHGLEGWTYQEVAQQLGVSVNAVGVLLHRARQRLRQLLASPSAGAAPGCGQTSPGKENL